MSDSARVTVIDAELAMDAAPWSQPDFDPSASAPASALTAAELGQVQEQAYREAHERGHAEGLASGRAAVDAELSRLRSIVSAMVRPFADLDDEVTQQLLRVATRMAEQLLRRELRADPDAMHELAREAVDAIRDQTRTITIRLNPEDAAAAQAWLAEAQEPAWRLMPDAALDAGDLQVRGENLSVDARVATRLQELSRTLQEPEPS